MKGKTQPVVNPDRRILRALNGAFGREDPELAARLAAVARRKKSRLRRKRPGGR